MCKYIVFLLSHSPLLCGLIALSSKAKWWVTLIVCTLAFNMVVPSVYANNLYDPIPRAPIDGEFAFSLTQDNIGKHANLAYQVTPWMRMGANYVQLKRPDSPASFRFDAAVKLHDARGYLPAIHLGMRDFTDQANLQTPFALWHPGTTNNGSLRPVPIRICMAVFSTHILNSHSNFKPVIKTRGVCWLINHGTRQIRSPTSMIHHSYRHLV